MDSERVGDRLQEIATGLYRFDTHYIRQRHTACYVVVEGGRAAIVDSGVPANVPPLLEALATLEIAPDAVEWVIPTHAHLDHAGGAGHIMPKLPAATLAAHPSAAPHLINPERLEAGVRALYGDEFFDREYAPVVPVDAERVVETPDGQEIKLGERILRVIHTPGHAWHHESILDTSTGTLIAGDAFGVAYPELIRENEPVVVPPGPPPQFKPEIYQASIDRILELSPSRVALTHFGVVDDPARVAADLHRLIDEWVELGREAGSAEELFQALIASCERELSQRGRSEDQSRFRKLYYWDLRLSAEGIWTWRQKQEKRSAEGHR
ncbi:MAG: MBL fold metallo-hydrolase [Spirochaetales bacterium]